MKARTIYGKICSAALAVVMLAAFSGCTHDDAEGGGAPVSDTPFMMSITVSMNSAGITRANHSDDYQENGTEAENFINFTDNDFRVILFDRSGNYLLEMDATDKWTTFPSASGGSSLTYRMECEIEFPENMSRETLNDIRDNGLQIMVLANWQSSGGRSAYEGGFSARTLSSIWKDGVNYNFNYTPGSGNLTWSPANTGETKKLIPMFGTAQSPRFEARTNGGVLYSTVVVPMQRAIAKIEVIDNLVSQRTLRVSDVTLSEFNTSGRFIPDVDANPDWNKQGSQVEKSSLPAGVRSGADLQFFYNDAERKWIAYVPEMALGNLFTDSGKKTVDENRPHLTVAITSSDPESVYTGATYPLHFARYDQSSLPTIPDDSWNHILRNHIYRFSVNKVGITAELHLHVIPWEKDDDEEWDFTDHVTIQKTLEWVKDTYETKEETSGRVGLWIDQDTTRILRGEFVISTPVNGRWYARLVPLDGSNPNAVSFVDAGGNVMEPSAGVPLACSEVSGIIEQERPARIYIRPTGFGNEDQSTFRLEFFVENLGVWMEVPMRQDDENKCYTIVRKGNKLE